MKRSQLLKLFAAESAAPFQRVAAAGAVSLLVHKGFGVQLLRIGR